MKRDEKAKIAVCFVVAVALIAGFWLALEQIEAHLGVGTVKAENAQLSWEEESGQAQGTLKLAGDKYDYQHEFETYLIMGTDASGNEKTEDKGYQGDMADFILLAVFDRTDDTYGFIQLDRDTMTEVTLLLEDNTGMATADLQLCTAHWYGGDEAAGCENTVQAVKKMLGGLPIDGYCSIDMEDIPTLNHLVGGVEVTLEDDFTQSDKEMVKGATLTLTDEQAYLYIRGRYGVGDETNASRMKRQKQYMHAFFEKVKVRMQEDRSFINDAYKQMEDVAVTDISGKQVSRLTKLIMEGESKGIREFEGTYKLGQALGDGLDHNEFYIDKESKIQVMTEMYGLEKREPKKSK